MIEKVKFEERPQTKKGAIGERIVREILTEKGFITYSPDNFDTAHAVDCIAIKDKKRIIIAETKAKPKMKKYNATGVNTSNLTEYIFISKTYNIPFFLFFVDEVLGRVYYGILDELLAPYNDELVNYPNTAISRDITLFSLDKMYPLRDLTPEEIVELETLSTRNHDYSLN